MKKKKSRKIPVRLNAQPTRPHSTKKGQRGYNRRQAKKEVRRELNQRGLTG